MGKRREETIKQKQVFDIYYAMGDKRSIASLHEYLKTIPEYSKSVPSIPTLKSWSKKYNWQLRVQQRDVEISKDLNKKINNDIINDKVEHRKLIGAIITELKRSLNEYRLKLMEGKSPVVIESVKDLKDLAQITETLINLDLSLIGENVQEPIQIIISKEIIPEDGN